MSVKRRENIFRKTALAGILFVVFHAIVVTGNSWTNQSVPGKDSFCGTTLEKKQSNAVVELVADVFLPGSEKEHSTNRVVFDADYLAALPESGFTWSKQQHRENLLFRAGFLLTFSVDHPS